MGDSELLLLPFSTDCSPPLDLVDLIPITITIGRVGSNPCHSMLTCEASELFSWVSIQSCLYMYTVIMIEKIILS